MYTSIAGKEVDYANGTIGDGKLELKLPIIGTSVYYMEGKAPKE